MAPTQNTIVTHNGARWLVTAIDNNTRTCTLTSLTAQITCTHVPYSNIAVTLPADIDQHAA